MSADTLIPAYRRLWLYALVVATLIFLILPVFIVIPASFSDSKYLAFPPPGYSLKWYRAYIESGDWLAATKTSLEVGALTVLVALPLGVAAAYAISNAKPLVSKIAQILFLLPIAVPHILIAIGIFYVYAIAGIVNTLAGIVLAHTLMALPFVIITVLSGLKSFDAQQEQVARSLGAPRWSAFLTVTLPQIRPSVFAAGLFAFVISLDEIVISLFIAGGDNTVLTRRMFVALRDAIDPTIAAISTFFIGLSLVLSVFVALLGRRAR